ncbi:MAG: type I-C CRISPR-associated protein Cas7/Csd2 [Verrucomicrobia bacterium]|nr:type I-C CRISPR-associated protein Cas7/Csd2 [Verrucomicrobiota bacterium]
MNNPIKNRYDFVYLFDCTDSNPNGDPDAANAPRLDPQTMQGLVSDVAIKRKIRNYVYLAKLGPDGTPAEGYDLHVKHGTVLNENIRKACDGTGLPRREDDAKGDKEKAKNRPPREIAQLQAWLCQKFYDIRTFGSVLSTGPNAGQLRGPVQISFARSIDPVLALDISITRICGTDEEKATEMGRKAAIPYGLYRCYGFVSAHLAQQTGFSEEDLNLLFRALCGRANENEQFQPSMMDPDVSSARRLAPQKLVVFKHDSMLGNAPAHKLFERVTVPKVGVARSFEDYKSKIAIDRNNLPPGVKLLELL